MVLLLFFSKSVNQVTILLIFNKLDVNLFTHTNNDTNILNEEFAMSYILELNILQLYQEIRALQG